MSDTVSKLILKVVPIVADPKANLLRLRGSILRYDDPLEPVGSKDRQPLG
jgi:hypothetical protein